MCARVPKNEEKSLKGEHINSIRFLTKNILFKGQKSEKSTKSSVQKQNVFNSHHHQFLFSSSTIIFIVF